MDPIEIVNFLCLGFTVAGALTLGQKGDVLPGWITYCIAATFGVVYFSFTGNVTQILLWIFFLVNNFLAIRRKLKKKDETPNKNET